VPVGRCRKGITAPGALKAQSWKFYRRRVGTVDGRLKRGFHASGMSEEEITSSGRTAMKQDSNAKVNRRDLLRALGASAVVAPGAQVSEAQADSENNDEKRKARYQADSADVKAFYRVNNYPK